MLNGIDVSVHNGKIDWEKVKKAGINFAMIRAGYGANNIDARFKYNISECNRLGIPCGVYWFSYALNADMARQEARYCLAAVKPYKLEYPIAFDFEYDSVSYAEKKGVQITKALASAIAKAFCSEIEKANYYVVNYTNKDYLNRYFDAEVNNKFGLWLAAWNKAEKPPMDCQIWQYGSNGEISGISGDVDVNRGYVDFPFLLKSKKKNNLDTKPYYYDALEWGKANGITDGSKPEEAVSLGRVITMLYRYHKKFGSGK